ncbi:enoyl-CoA hydratase [Rhodococcus sp. 06-418-1B]|nr:crotonase/enoyl-CoA hydratase family protein [Rhodococcus sp. 06-418-1B]OZC83395.1 enoyl-CoA hydratase [Rhodococcus sp. 06-418-1B]
MNLSPSASLDDQVLLERRGHLLVITINRPEARNAINVEVSMRIGEALDFADSETEVRAVVITGAGDLAFSAGQDLKEAALGIRPTDPRMNRWGFAGITKHSTSKPIIAAVNGAALGGGAEIAMASDVIVASETATFGLPEVRRGIIAGAGGAFRLGKQIPPKIALEVMLTGTALTAEKALKYGLVNKVVPAGNALDEACVLADLIAANAPVAVQATKRLARGIASGQIDSETLQWARTSTEMEIIRSSADAQEGIRAFIEKRQPEWRGN